MLRCSRPSRRPAHLPLAAFLLATLATFASPALADPEVNVRAGRGMAVAGWSAMGAGGLLLGVGEGLLVYNYDGPWEEKYRYDRRYEARSGAGLGFVVAGSIFLGASLPTLTTGTLLEAQGLHKLHGHVTAPGWTALGMFGVGAVLGGIGAATDSEPLGITAGVFAGTGFTLIVTQFSLNAAASRRMDAAERRALYRPKRAARMAAIGLAPQLGPTQGVMLVGTF
jgi:hypothetical protein